MKIRRIIAVFAAVFVPFLLFRVGSGLTEQQNVTLRDYTVSEDGKTLTLHAAVFPPIEDIRNYKDEPKNGEHYLTFYNAFGSANTMSAGYTVVLPIEDMDKADDWVSENVLGNIVQSLKDCDILYFTRSYEENSEIGRAHV